MSAAEHLTLENVRIASPCSADWTKMVGDDRVRFCNACEKHVYNVAGLSRDEATSLINGQGEVCVRLAQRADGTVITNDCPVGAKSVARTRRALAVVGGTLLAASALVLRYRAAASDELAPAATTHLDGVTLPKQPPVRRGTDLWGELHEALRKKLEPAPAVEEPRMVNGRVAKPSSPNALIPRPPVRER